MRRGTLLRVVAPALAALLVACGGAGDPTAAPTAQPTVAAVATASPTPTARPSPSPAATPTAPAAPSPATPSVAEVGVPVRIRIPAIGVDAAVELVGLDAEQAMDVPRDPLNTAWYQYGPRPGQPGNAVIAGHVDYRDRGPVVFYRLLELQQGDEVIAVDDKGVERRFVVTANETYPRRDAPLDKIFGPTSGAGLVLITCDRESTFDRDRREYRNNIVVYTEAGR